MPAMWSFKILFSKIPFNKDTIDMQNTCTTLFKQYKTKVLQFTNLKFNKEVFVKHEKAPTAPRFQGVLTISYMPTFRKTAVFGHFG